jgi:O-antigen/teichoic acid export membrane protein
LKNQIIYTIIIRFSSVAANLVLIPLLYNSLPSDSFGFWITLLSLAGWVSLLDIGIGQGLRNGVTVAIVKNDHKTSRELISTTYIVSFFLSFIFFIIFSIFLFYFDVSKELGISSISPEDVRYIIFVVLISVSFNFIVSTVNQLYHAVQLSGLAALMNLFSSLLFLIFTFVYVKFLGNDLVIISYLFLFSTAISGIFISFVYFKKFPFLKPRLNEFNVHSVRSLLKIGGNFFIIQIGMSFLYSTDNFLIGKYFGSSSIRDYAVAFKLFSSISLLAGLIMTPLWSAYTKAKHENNFDFIHKALKIQYRMLSLVVFLLFFLVLFCDKILDIWISGEVLVDINLKISLAVMTFLTIWNSIYANLLNGLEQTKLQMKTSIFAILFNVPLSFLFVNYLHLGISGIIYATCFCLFLFSVSAPFEAKKYINGNFNLIV